MDEMSTTQMNHHVHNPGALWVLIDGPCWDDAGFLGAWLIAAAKAKAF
jgi:hypothetical protein